MNENEIITYDLDKEFDRNNIKIEKSKRKRKKKFKKLRVAFSLLIIGLLAYGAFKLYPYLEPKIKDFFTNNSENTDTPPNINEENQENPSTPNEALPNENENQTDNRFQIIEATSSYIFINESQYTFEQSTDFSHIKAYDIYEKYGSDAPLVLITHFSCLESYSDGKGYLPTDEFYSELSNVGDIGATLSLHLNNLGINTIHLNEIYAQGGLYNSKKEYENAVNALLLQYPSISYVLNVSRDVVINKDMSMIKGTVGYEENTLAQLSFISGSFNDTMNENQLKNANLAFSLASYLNSIIDSFVYRNTVSSFPLSQNLTPFCIEVEFGSYANSFEEAENSAIYFAELFTRYLTE